MNMKTMKNKMLAAIEDSKDYVYYSDDDRLYWKVQDDKAAAACADICNEYCNGLMKRMAFIGMIMMVSAFIFAVIETLYFNSNFFPESKSELICDYLAAFICGGGGTLFVYAATIRAINDIKYILNK